MIKKAQLISFFKLPLIVLTGVLLYVFLHYALRADLAGVVVIYATIVLGSYGLVKEIIVSLWHRQFALDYIALLAVVVAVLTQQYLVAGIIVFMFSGGNTLEEYGMNRAKQSLTALTTRIPSEVVLWDGGKAEHHLPIAEVIVGQEILVRKGEVIPLDGFLVSESGLTDESSLTGEPYMLEKMQGDHVRSGTINSGNPMVVRVSKRDEDSTYRKIIDMVKQAQQEKAPLLRLADRYSVVFTIITLVLSALAYGISHSIAAVLAVLVIATPCPLILATPIAMFGGMNAAAKQRILVKKLSGLETLSRVTSVIFDKTGTITFGQPSISDLEILDTRYTKLDVYGIAEAIERNSLHPLAKAIVEGARGLHAAKYFATEVQEEVGKGIVATIDGKKYGLTKMHAYSRSAAVELVEGETPIARFLFEDTLKTDAQHTLHRLHTNGVSLHLYTGDKQENAERIVNQLGEVGTVMEVKTNCSPEDKKNGIAVLKKGGKVVAMVGDGINDAPALAFADVGMVFSHEEHTAASEAADIIFLGGDLSAVSEIFTISKRTIRIALQSIVFGIGMSTVGMILAAFGYIPAVYGAFLQELIDVLVIFNALRASR